MASFSNASFLRTKTSNLHMHLVGTRIERLSMEPRYIASVLSHMFFHQSSCMQKKTPLFSLQKACQRLQKFDSTSCGVSAISHAAAAAKPRLRTLKHTTSLIHLISTRLKIKELPAPKLQCRAARGNVFQELTAVKPMMFRYIQGRSIGDLSHAHYTLPTPKDSGLGRRSVDLTQFPNFAVPK